MLLQHQFTKFTTRICGHVSLLSTVLGPKFPTGGLMQHKFAVHVLSTKEMRVTKTSNSSANRKSIVEEVDGRCDSIIKFPHKCYYKVALFILLSFGQCKSTSAARMVNLHILHNQDIEAICSSVPAS